MSENKIVWKLKIKYSLGLWVVLGYILLLFLWFIIHLCIYEHFPQFCFDMFRTNRTFEEYLGPPEAGHDVTVEKGMNQIQGYKYVIEVDSTWLRSFSKTKVHVFCWLQLVKIQPHRGSLWQPAREGTAIGWRSGRRIGPWSTFGRVVTDFWRLAKGLNPFWQRFNPKRGGALPPPSFAKGKIRRFLYLRSSSYWVFRWARENRKDSP